MVSQESYRATAWQGLVSQESYRATPIRFRIDFAQALVNSMCPPCFQRAILDPWLLQCLQWLLTTPLARQYIRRLHRLTLYQEVKNNNSSMSIVPVSSCLKIRSI